MAYVEFLAHLKNLRTLSLGAFIHARRPGSESYGRAEQDALEVFRALPHLRIVGLQGAYFDVKHGAKGLEAVLEPENGPYPGVTLKAAGSKLGADQWVRVRT